MLQTRRLKAKFNGVLDLNKNNTILRKKNFTSKLKKYDLELPRTIISTDGKEYTFERRLFECQMEKFIYRSGYDSFINIW